MANFTAADIKALRERTGAGMLDVKKALDEADGDQTKAMEIIRVKGLKGISKREARSASDGLVAAVIQAEGDQQVGYLVEINSETDFVAKNKVFTDLADRVVAAAAKSGAGDVEQLLAADAEGSTVADVVNDAAATLGEKLVVNRVQRVAGAHVSKYLHRTNKDIPPQVGVLVASDEAGAEAAHDVALHVAAYAPTYLNREQVPEDQVADERRIAEETAVNEGKPEKAIPKIIEGRLNGFFKDCVLLDQPFAKDPKQSVGKFVADTGGQITGFARIRVGS
ncbi:MAG TPA: translation elongation factor Ts [Ruania sp.]|nr:translation elongation factor Ts [Ruania sp.]